jgi:hypothetical protein
MSWIKDNKFVAALGGGTLVGVVLLYFVGSNGAEKYETAKTNFDTAAAEAATYEKGPLYPSDENLQGKDKALNEYRTALDALQGDFEKFRPKEIKNVSPQEFTTRLKAVNEEVVAAFAASDTIDRKVKIPELFFCGFEDYGTDLARTEATGLLDYQLHGVRKILLALAKSEITELKNVHRPPLSEESGTDFKPGETDVARPMPLELTFSGPEKAVRNFLSSIVKPDEQYAVVRTIRITNAKKDPPRASDAKFDKPAAAKPASSTSIFGGGDFVFPEDDAKEGEKKPEDAPKPKPAPADSSRILAQVLGNEEVQVFIRLDMMQFLPAKKLP